MMTSSPQAETAPDEQAFGLFADHCVQCRTCKAVDEQGANLRLPCAEQDRLRGEYRQARKAGQA